MELIEYRYFHPAEKVLPEHLICGEYLIVVPDAG
jgi:hypothetical protein